MILETAKGEELKLNEIYADVVFFGIVLHDFENPLKVLANAHSMLKPTGKLVNLDWKNEPMDLGPPSHIRFSEEKAKHLIESSGFKVQLIKESGLYHYIIIAELSESKIN